jgi:hypothetical protein
MGTHTPVYLPILAKWVGLKHDKIGLIRAQPDTKDSGSCWPRDLYQAVPRPRLWQVMSGTARLIWPGLLARWLARLTGLTKKCYKIFLLYYLM